MLSTLYIIKHDKNNQAYLSTHYYISPHFNLILNNTQINNS